MRSIVIFSYLVFALALSGCGAGARAENEDAPLTPLQRTHFEQLRDRCISEVDTQMAAREAEIRAQGNVPGYVLNEQPITRQQYRENEVVVCMVRNGPLDPVLAPLFINSPSRQTT
jgi:hypothetical protein